MQIGPRRNGCKVSLGRHLGASEDFGKKFRERKFYGSGFFMGTADNDSIFPGRKMGIMGLRNRIDFVGTVFPIRSMRRLPLKSRQKILCHLKLTLWNIHKWINSIYFMSICLRLGLIMAVLPF